jgi:membrane associated rhomboid family serine protease
LKTRAGSLRNESAPFDAALRSRTRLVPLASALVALNAGVFILMLAAPGAVGDPATLTDWGASVGPRTSNGEWWRLVTAMFVHAGVWHLLACLAPLVQVGALLERLAGRPALAVVYATAGLASGLVSLAGRQVAVHAGASGAVFGLYGLLMAASLWTWPSQSPLRIPLAAWKRLAPAAVLFVAFNGPNGALPASGELAGLGAGFVWGLVLTQGLGVRQPSVRRVAAALAATVAIAVAGAVSLRGITDVRLELATIAPLEERTAGLYEAAAARFRKRQIDGDELARQIEETILPELQDVGARLKALTGVPPEHRQLVADAEEYVRLRSESWRLRAQGLREADPREGSVERRRAEERHAASAATLGKAEGRERAALEALHRTGPALE